jgi:hypothetical protein
MGAALTCGRTLSLPAHQATRPFPFYSPFSCSPLRACSMKRSIALCVLPLILSLSIRLSTVMTLEILRSGNELGLGADMALGRDRDARCGQCTAEDFGLLL